MKLQENTILSLENFRNKKCPGLMIFSWNVLLHEKWKGPREEKPATLGPPFSFYLDFIKILSNIPIKSEWNLDKMRYYKIWIKSGSNLDQAGKNTSS